MIKYKIKHKIVNCVKIGSVTSHDLYPLPPLSHVTNCHTFSDPPWSVTYFMDGPFALCGLPCLFSILNVYYFFGRVLVAEKGPTTYVPHPHGSIFLSHIWTSSNLNDILYKLYNFYAIVIHIDSFSWATWKANQPDQLPVSRRFSRSLNSGGPGSKVSVVW